MKSKQQKVLYHTLAIHYPMPYRKALFCVRGGLAPNLNTDFRQLTCVYVHVRVRNVSKAFEYHLHIDTDQVLT